MQYDEEVPQSTETEEDISPEELLNQPIFIPFRTKKDPRDLKILDPACGSGHFLLYAFDLLETIYKEAWVDNDNPISLVTGTRLRNDYADLDALRRALPGLILRHNLYGIDIDPRACQIAALALWLRTQRSYQQLGLHGAERPQITKSNIVCAEPMPGEREMLEEYLTQYVDPRLHDLVLTIWEKMQLAGEAGTLLKIEEEIETALREARMRAMVDVQPVQVPLFEGKIAVQQSMSFTAVEEQTFWSNAEGELLGALRDYATRATNGNATQRRLFAEDATQGFAFIDLARNRFDVVLMNPPFGQSVPDGDNYIRRQYTETWKDLYAAFLERSILGLAKDGMTGCISSSLFLYTKQLRGLRQMWIDRQSLVFLVELGSGVLDAATVDTALTITRPEAINSTVFCDLTHVGMEIKGHTLLETTSNCDARLVARHLTIFQSIYSSPFCYHLTNQKLQLWNQGDRLDPNYGSVVLGNHTFDDERFLRLRWEVPHATLGHRWFGYEKGGEYQPYFAPTPLLYNWEADGKEARAYQSTRYGTDAQVSQSITWWWKPGITYPRVTSVGFGPRVMPSKHIFSSESISFFPSESYSSLALLAFLCSSWAQDLLYAFGRYRKIENRAVSNLPLSTSIFDVYTRALHEVGVKGVTLLMQLEELEETSSLFLAPAHQTKGSIGGGEKRKQLYNALVHQAAETDALVAKMLFGESVPSLAAEPRGNLVSRYVCRNDDNNAARVDSLVSYAVGCSFGRWDVRLALNSELQTKPPSPFDSLPICPPGMLLSPTGLPASQNNIVSEAWLRSRPNVISIPLGGIVRQSKISDEEYPVHIAWDGILVDDQEHSSDIVLHVREVFSVLWPGDDGALAEAIEREVCEILGVKDLHEYFRRYSGFFANHLKRYSKSRRQAPIYWPISTASGSYTLWIYYHRLTSDTLFTVVNQYIEPKITEIQRKIGELEGRLTGTTGREATRLREEVESARALLAELQDFRAELLGVAALPYRPDLNDGVSINAAPLHRLFRLPKWAKDTKACWEKLQRGEYDWAHLAYTIWPDRVREKCRVDRSLAIAHDQEHLYLEQPTMAQRKRGRKAVPDKEDEE